MKTQFVRFKRLQDGTAIAVLANPGGREFNINQKSLADRISNLRNQNLDTSVDEDVLAQLRERNMMNSAELRDWLVGHRIIEVEAKDGDDNQIIIYSISLDDGSVLEFSASDHLGIDEVWAEITKVEAPS